MRTPSKYIWADRDLTTLSDPRANPTRQIYKPRYARRAFGPPRFARNKRLRNTINTRMREEKSDYYSNQLADEQDPKAIWQTLHKIVPKEIKSVPSSCDGPTASSFNGFFTSIASTLCSHFKRCSLPKVLTPRVKHDFVLEVLYKKNCSK